MVAMKPLCLHLLSSLTNSTVTVDIDRRTESALATFTVDGEPCGSMSIWLDGIEVQGFILRGTSYSIELVVRDLRALTGEPELASLLDAVCYTGRLHNPSSRAPHDPGSEVTGGGERIKANTPAAPESLPAAAAHSEER